MVRLAELHIGSAIGYENTCLEIIFHFCNVVKEL